MAAEPKDLQDDKPFFIIRDEEMELCAIVASMDGTVLLFKEHIKDGCGRVEILRDRRETKRKTEKTNLGSAQALTFCGICEAGLRPRRPCGRHDRRTLLRFGDGIKGAS